MASQLLIQLPIYLTVLLLSSVLRVEVAQAETPILAQPGCNYTCGNLIIPFPFGIGADCSLDHWFEIECRESPNSIAKPFLSAFNIEVMEVNFYEITTVKVNMPPLNACSADKHQKLNSTDFRGSPYNYSTQANAFVMEGCPVSAVLFNQRKEIMAQCDAVCKSSSNNSEIPMNSCYGVHCCQTRLPSGHFGFRSPLQFYQVDFDGQYSSGGHQNCPVATLIESEFMNQYSFGMLSSSNPPTVPVVLLWTWTSKLLPDDPRAICYNGGIHDKLFCYCKNGYYGNPYLSDGCQVPQECKDCQGYCSGEWNLTGHLILSYDYYCEKKPLLKLAAILGFSVSSGIILLVIGVYGLYHFVKRMRERKQRAKFFKRNGGLLLHQQLSTSEGVVERTKIFSMKELDKATDHFNENRILGQGGQGTIYKGMLTDGRIVAIKRSKLLDESQLQQFINEVVILSQLNHRNVVKLLGCCLETEVPLLVYEFVPNGTLFQHIHDPDEDFAISWEMCLKIAADSASAISYLHSSSSTPIFHRDIKSSNILLDENRRAKVSDFGSSKTIAIDKTHVTTLVQGTMGYLDPEYFQSYQITEKSDVFSFGVVLLELLTRKKPIYRDVSTMEQKNLVTEFLFLFENSRLLDILDPKTAEEAKEDELMSTVELARRCISWSGKLRPTMKEVAMTLEIIMKSPSKVLRWYREEEEALANSDERSDEYVMAGLSDAKFTSSTLHARAASPPIH